MSDDKVLKGVVKGLGQIGLETVEKLGDESQKIVESIITGKELLGLERTMTDEELALKKREEAIKSKQEIASLKESVAVDKKDSDNHHENKIKERPRDVEDELTQLRRKKEKEEEEKQRYYEQQRQEQEKARERQQAEYVDLMAESTNPAKQKKSRGSAFANKRKKPDMSQMSATQEFNKGGKID